MTALTGWQMKLVRAGKTLKAGGMVFTWSPGQNSLHDNRDISKGRDVGNIIVQKPGAGKLVDGTLRRHRRLQGLPPGWHAAPELISFGCRLERF